jgi:hypothetical protein
LDTFHRNVHDVLLGMSPREVVAHIIN